MFLCRVTLRSETKHSSKVSDEAKLTSCFKDGLLFLSVLKLPGSSSMESIIIQSGTGGGI